MKIMKEETVFLSEKENKAFDLTITVLNRVRNSCETSELQRIADEAEKVLYNFWYDCKTLEENE